MITQVPSSETSTNLGQTEIWVDKQGVTHRIEEMSVRYKENVVHFLLRRAPSIVGRAMVDAQVRALEKLYEPMIRRAAGHASSELTCGPLRVDTKASKAQVNGVPLKVTSHEFRLLAYLMHHMGEVVSRTELVEHLYDQDFDRDSNTIEVFVGRLRKKMGVDMIETVRGMGYRIREPEA